MAKFKQNYQELKNQIDHLTNCLNFPLRVQKMYSTEHFISMEVRAPGKTYRLYLGRGSNYEGLYVWEKKPPSDFRIRDQYLEYLRKIFRTQKIAKLKLHSFDRILRIYLNEEKQGVLGFFWKGAKLIFYHVYASGNGFEAFLSSGKKRVFDATSLEWVVAELEKEMGAREAAEFKDARVLAEVEDYFGFYKKNYLKKVIDKRKRNRLKRKISNVSGDIHKLTELVKIEELTYFENKEKLEAIERMQVAGKKFIFGKKTYYQKRDVIFQKLKNFKTHLERQKSSLIELQLQLEDESLFTVQKSAKIVRVIEFKREESRSKSQISNAPSSGSYRTYKIQGGKKLHIGLSTKGNDEIRNKLAKKSDIWIHLENYTSAHIILADSNYSDITETLLSTVAGLLRDQSSYTILNIPLQYTEVKNLKGLKGQAGGVIVKKAKFITVSYDPNWRHNIEME